MKRARSSDIPIVPDAERIFSPEVATLIDQVDHAVGPLGFSTQVTGRQDPRHFVSALWNDDRAAMMLTIDANGAFAWCLTRGDTALERVRTASAAAAVVAALPTEARRVPTVERITHLLAVGETR